MSIYSLVHLSDEVLEHRLDSLVGRDRGNTAEIVAHIAEMDRRGSYAPVYTSMHAYCLGRLHLSEDSAYKRIQAARAALEFPLLFETLADGRLNLSAVCLIAPHLKSENVGQLVAMATHKSNAAIRQWLADRAARNRPAAAAAAAPAPARQLEVRLPRLAVQQVEGPVATVPQVLMREPVAGPAGYDMHFTMTPEDHEDFRNAQALWSHAVPSGDVAEVYRRAIKLMIQEGEKRKFAATPRPQVKGGAVRGRRIPAAVRRAVGKRDGGRCTFVARSGHRCGSRAFLEFDHIVPVARGGLATEENLRLRCRPHNQAAARHVFGAKFVQERQRKAHARRDEPPLGTEGVRARNNRDIQVGLPSPPG